MYPLLKKYLSRDISITDEQFSAASKLFHLKTTKRNEVLVESGDISRYMYFVNKGYLRIFLLNADGKESTRFLVPQGRFGTSFPSFILQEPSLAYVQSVGPSELLMIN